MSWQRQRSDINVTEFYRIIQKYGYAVEWSKSSICPCVAKGSNGQPEFNCPLCKGKGRHWYDPKDIQGIMTSFNQKPEYNQTGEIMMGNSYFTTLPQYKLSLWDRLTHFNSQLRYSELMEKGDPGTPDKLRFQPIEILSLRTITKTYTLGEEFLLDEKDWGINWQSGAPMRGERYSVDYLTYPRWLVTDLPHVIRDTIVKSKKPGLTFIQMPVQAVVKLEFYI